MRNKTWIIIGMMVIVICFIFIKGVSIINSKNINTQAVPIITPTLSSSFALKQQCSNDAYQYVDHENQREQNQLIQNEQASYGTTDLIYDVMSSTFDQKLNTCIASLSSTSDYKGKLDTYFEVIELPSQKDLAQDDSLNPSENFNPYEVCDKGKYQKGYSQDGKPLSIPPEMSTIKSVCPIPDVDYFGYLDSVGLGE